MTAGMQDELTVELFAGPGGASEGIRRAGFTGHLYGFEWNSDACATATAAGHTRFQADVSTYPLTAIPGKVAGMWGSPTCRTFTTTGNGAGRVDAQRVLDRMRAYADGVAPPEVEWVDERSLLTAEPMRWAAALMPRWIACEQVPAVLPLWDHMAGLLAGLGYSVWTGILQAEQYGVASTRKRAILTARLDGSVFAPTPTHAEPLSMADVLGWDGAELVSNYGSNGDASRRGRRPMSKPAFTITGKACRNRWEWPDGTTRNLTITEAAQLQGFRADYPWVGGSISRQQQVGDTVPPALAAAIVRPLLIPAVLAVAA